MEGRVMADDTCKLSITYSSGLIPPPELMSTLAVFYDEIWLPNAYWFDIGNFEYYKEYYKGFNERISSLSDEGRQGLEIGQRFFNSFKSQWNILYEKDIIRVLPAYESFYLKDAKKYLNVNFFDRDIIRLLERLIHKQDSVSSIKSDEIYDEFSFNICSRIALLFHLCNYDKLTPELFFNDNSNLTTSRISFLLTQEVFQYKFPQLQNLNAEQVLEVREYLKDTKEGFTYYINEMTDDVKRRIREDNLSDLEASQETFERKIQPQYEEFRRKLAAKKTGFWAKIAAASGTFLLVTTGQWDLALLGAVLQWAGLSLDTLSKDEQENFLSTKSKAFNYIATLSEVSKRLP